VISSVTALSKGSRSGILPISQSRYCGLSVLFVIVMIATVATTVQRWRWGCFPECAAIASRMSSNGAPASYATLKAPERWTDDGWLAQERMA
jgi:hypothetical protein